MEVGESVSSSLRRILTKDVFAAVKPAIAEEIGNLGQRVDAIIQNATEVCLIMWTYVCVFLVTREAVSIPDSIIATFTGELYTSLCFVDHQEKRTLL